MHVFGSLVFSVIFGLPTLILSRMQTVGVRGNFTCGEESAKFLLLEMICGMAVA